MKRIFSLIIIASISFGFFSCDDDEDNVMNNNGGEEPVTGSVELTQELFDASNEDGNAIKLGVTDDDPIASSAHAGIRDVFTNMSDASGKAQPGDVITKYRYRDNNGERGDLITVYAMVKQGEGVDGSNGGWKWYSSSENSFASMSLVSGEGNFCYGCHRSGTDGRFVFPD